MVVEETMRFSALATDYDGTLASSGTVAEKTWDALSRLKASGRKILLVTGRVLDDLRSICPHLEVFDRVVVENGGVLYRPATREQQILAPAPPTEFIQTLRGRGVAHLDVGRTIVATLRTYETEVRDVIASLNLPMQIIFNKEAVMVLPRGINKASGLKAALDELSLSPQHVVAIGDAENDRAFLEICGCSAAVANALPIVKDRADIVTSGQEGDGVVELIDRLLAVNRMSPPITNPFPRQENP